MFDMDNPLSYSEIFERIKEIIKSIPLLFHDPLLGSNDILFSEENNIMCPEASSERSHNDSPFFLFLWTVNLLENRQSDLITLKNFMEPFCLARTTGEEVQIGAIPPFCSHFFG